MGQLIWSSATPGRFAGKSIGEPHDEVPRQRILAAKNPDCDEAPRRQVLAPTEPHGEES